MSNTKDVTRNVTRTKVSCDTYDKNTRTTIVRDFNLIGDYSKKSEEFIFKKLITEKLEKGVIPVKLISVSTDILKFKMPLDKFIENSEIVNFEEEVSENE